MLMWREVPGFLGPFLHKKVKILNLKKIESARIEKPAYEAETTQRNTISFWSLTFKLTNWLSQQLLSDTNLQCGKTFITRFSPHFLAKHCFWKFSIKIAKCVPLRNKTTPHLWAFLFWLWLVWFLDLAIVRSVRERGQLFLRQKDSYVSPIDQSTEWRIQQLLHGLSLHDDDGGDPVRTGSSAPSSSSRLPARSAWSSWWESWKRGGENIF